MAAGAFYTYLHCRPDGSPFYVGKGITNRKGNRSQQFKCRSQYHKNIVDKYGRENIGIFVFPCDSEEQAFQDEIQQIAQLRREGYELCNMTDGGEGVSGYAHSAETRVKIHISKLGNTCGLGTKRTPEQRVKFSIAQKNVVIKEATKAHWFIKKYQPWNKNARPKTHCKKGHSLSGDNLHEGIRTDGRKFRNCRTCEREASAAYQLRKRGV